MYVHPHLEYCIQACTLYFKKNINCLESPGKGNQISKKFEKTVTYKRPEALDLYCLQRRRIKGDLIDTLKILTRRDKVNYESFTMARSGHSMGNSLKLFKGRARLDVRKHFFSQRVIEAWNKLVNEEMKAVSQQIHKRS